MKDTIRTFIAIKITAGEKLSELTSELKKSLNNEEIRWVDINNLHLTLRFLGETNTQQVTEVINLLESVSQDYQVFQFGLKGVGFFKSNGQPRVLFFDVENDLILKQLVSEIEGGLVKSGFPAEEKTFNPHLTIGRIKSISDKEGFKSLVHRFIDTEIQQVTVTEIIYYQSILNYEGPVYKPIKTVKLKSV